MLLATVIGFLLIGACAAVEAGVVATFGHDGLEAGIVLALFSVGSLAGGLTFGHIPIGPWAMARRLAIVTVGLALTMVSLNVWWLGGTLVLAGIGIAPALAVLFAMTIGQREVQRHGRGVRLGRHRSADRRSRGIGDRRAS